MVAVAKTAVMATYEDLQKSFPFRSWKLPPAEKIEFKIECLHKWHGYAECNGFDNTIIGIDRRLLKDPPLLKMVMAHEMIHVSTDLEGDMKGAHNARFKRKARIVCKEHQWDFETFMFSG